MRLLLIVKFERVGYQCYSLTPMNEVNEGAHHGLRSIMLGEDYDGEGRKSMGFSCSSG
jgi:hypothetical protein